MSARNKDEIVSRFMGITQCSNKHAREYLESANWNEQAAMDFFYDSGAVPVSEPVPPPKPKPTEIKTNTNVSKKPEPNQTNPYDDDDDLLQSALEESLQLKAAQKSPVAVPKRIDNKKSIITSKINTFDTFRNNKDDDDDDEEKGQAFYAGGSERSGQQILGPPKSRGDDNNVKKVFDAARKQGAREADDDDQSNSSTRSKNEKPFAGVGHSLGDNNTSARTQDQPPSGATAAAASNAVEQLPIRFYSNGFTVGDGELRKFEDNKEFMEYIKRSEVPPELKNRTANGRQIEVRLEDHQSEEYKRVAPTFKPFGGAGHTVGLPRSDPSQFKSSSIATPVHTNSESPDASRLEKLAEKRLKTSSSSTTIRLRLPDLSTPISIKIDLNRTLNDVRRFLNENVPSLQSNTFEFMEPPSTKIKREDERQKISDTHFSNSTLAVRRTA